MVEASASESRFSIVPDPIPDRKLKDSECPRIINKPLSDSDLYSEPGKPNWTLIKDFLAREGPITKSQITQILMDTLQLFSSEANLV